MRKLPKQMSQFSSFYRDGITGREIQGKTLLVVGVGNIGYEIVRIGRGLDMTVYGVDIVKNTPMLITSNLMQKFRRRISSSRP
jgi:D-lactate dehydrogenase